MTAQIEGYVRPGQELSDEDHMAAFVAGKIRYVRKHVGPTYVAHHGDSGWTLFDGDRDVTAKHPTHVAKLMCSLLPVGTTMFGEMTVVRPGLKCDDDDARATEAMDHACADELVELVKTKRVREPVFFVRDVIQWEGQTTSETTYDDRQKLLRDAMLFGSDCIQQAEKAPGVNPQNWRAVLEHLAWDGIFAYDPSALIGAPTHCFELRVDPIELVTVVASTKTGKSRSRELVLAQRRGTDGSWFCRGRVPSSAGGWKPVVKAMEQSGVPTIDDTETGALDGLMRLGRGIVVELDRQADPTKLTFRRLRTDKRPDDCVAPR